MVTNPLERPARVAFLAHDGAADMGGVASWMGDLAPWLRRTGVEARVYGFVRPGETPLFDQLAASGVPVTSTEHAPATRSIGSRATWLCEQIQHDRIDVLIPNYFISGFLAASWLGRARPRTVAVLHSDDPLYRRVLREVARHDPFFPADAVVAVSRYLEEMVRARLGTTLPLARIPYGVPAPAAAASSPQHELRVVYSGRLEQEQKRILDTVLVACEAVARDPGIRVDFVGDGSKRAECERLVAARGVGTRVQFLGRLPLSEVRQRLPGYHAFLLLSEYEGLPVALLEAVTAGLVPICTRMHSGIAEVIDHEVSGLLVDEPTGAIEALRRLRRDPSLWQRCADGARARATHYQMDACGAEWHGLIERLAREPANAPRRTGVSVRSVPAPMEEFAFDDDRGRPAAWRMALRRCLDGLTRRYRS